MLKAPALPRKTLRLAGCWPVLTDCPHHSNHVTEGNRVGGFGQSKQIRLALSQLALIMTFACAFPAMVDAQESDSPAKEETTEAQAADPAPATQDDSDPQPAATDEAGQAKEAEAVAKAATVPQPVDAATAKVTYPRAVAIVGKGLAVVDLDLPGVWLHEGETSTLHTPGTKLYRKPMNRPWCAIAHPDGGLLISDSATREIYHAAKPGPELTALTGGYLGIPMALAVSPDGKTLYVGDAERRSVFKLPIAGGKPTLVAKGVNARALSFDAEGMLWAITPDANAVVMIDPGSQEDPQKYRGTTVVGERPYQFPNGLVWAGDEGFVTDSYGKAIWRFTKEGKTEIWHQGEPLDLPVGITADDEAVYVADPRKKQVYRFDRKTKAAEPVFK